MSLASLSLTRCLSMFFLFEKRFSTTPFAAWSFPFLLCLLRTTTATTKTYQNKKQSMKTNVKTRIRKIYRRGFALFDACCGFCQTDKLYESLRRKPGWRFTAGFEFWTFVLSLIFFPNSLWKMMSLVSSTSLPGGNLVDGLPPASSFLELFQKCYVRYPWPFELAFFPRSMIV